VKGLQRDLKWELGAYTLANKYQMVLSCPSRCRIKDSCGRIKGFFIMKLPNL